MSVACPTGVRLVYFFALDFSVIRRLGISIVGQLTESVSPCF